MWSGGLEAGPCGPPGWLAFPEYEACLNCKDANPEGETIQNPSLISSGYEFRPRSAIGAEKQKLGVLGSARGQVRKR